MSITQDLYSKALEAEKEYLKLVNLRNNTNFSTLREALENYFYNPKLGQGMNFAYKKGMSRDNAIKQLQKFEKKVGYSLNLYMNDNFNAFIAKEISQIQSMKNKKQEKLRVAGFFDEAMFTKMIKEVFPFQDDVITDENKSYTFSSRLDYSSKRGGDFSLTINAVGDKNGIFDASDIKKEGKINFENKLNLSNFHITDGQITKNDDFEKIIKDLPQLTKETHNVYTGNLDYDFSNMDNYEDNIMYNYYEYYIKKDTFSKIIANYILYKKISSTLPIFVSPQSKGIDFKLSSELIKEVNEGNFTLEDDLKPGDISIAFTEEKDFEKKLIESAILKVGQYSLWYGK